MSRQIRALEHLGLETKRNMLRGLKEKLFDAECKVLDFEDLGKDPHVKLQEQRVEALRDEIVVEEERLQVYLLKIGGEQDNEVVES